MKFYVVYGPVAPVGVTDDSTKTLDVLGTTITEVSPATQTLQPSGFAEINAFGTPALSPGAVTLQLSGFAGIDQFGTAVLSAGAVTLLPSGFAGTDAFGALSLALNLQLSGLANAAAFGTATLSQPVALELSGFAESEAFGTAILSSGAVTLQLSGFADADSFGTPELSVGPATLHLAGFADADGFGHPQLAPGAVELSLAGFASANGFGALSLRLHLALSGFADLNAFGALTLAPGPVALHLTGLTEVDRFGAARLIPGPVTITLSGFADPDAFGVPLLQLKKKAGQGGGTKPGGVGAAQKYATRIVMAEAGLITALEVDANVAKSVNTRMVLYADVGGLPGALLAQSAVKTGVVLGSNSYALITPRAVLAGTAVWAALHSDGNFNWFLSAGPTSRFNADAFADGPSDPFGASTLENNKAPVFVVFLEAVTLQLTAAGVADADLFGTPRFVPAAPQPIVATGFAGTSAFGALKLVPDQALRLSGFAPLNDFGAPALRPASATIALDGFVDADGFGAIELRGAQALSLAGFTKANRFGAAALVREPGLVGGSDLVLRNRNRRLRELALEDDRRVLASRAERARRLQNADERLRELTSR